MTPGRWNVWTATEPNEVGARFYIDAWDEASTWNDSVRSTHTVAMVFDEQDAKAIAALPKLLEVLKQAQAKIDGDNRALSSDIISENIARVLAQAGL